MLELPDRGMNNTCKNREKRKTNLMNISKKQILYSESRDTEGQLHNVDKIIKGLEEKFLFLLKTLIRKRICLYFLQQITLTGSLRKQNKILKS